MIHIFSNLSIRVKLTLTIAATSFVLLLLASTSFLINDRSNTRTTVNNQMTLLAEILADNSISAIEFDDAETATELLRSLKREEQITWAQITLARHG